METNLGLPGISLPQPYPSSTQLKSGLWPKHAAVLNECPRCTYTGFPPHEFTCIWLYSLQPQLLLLPHSPPLTLGGRLHFRGMALVHYNSRVSVSKSQYLLGVYWLCFAIHLRKKTLTGSWFKRMVDKDLCSVR